MPARNVLRVIGVTALLGVAAGPAFALEGFSSALGFFTKTSEPKGSLDGTHRYTDADGTFATDGHLSAGEGMSLGFHYGFTEVIGIEYGIQGTFHQAKQSVDTTILDSDDFGSIITQSFGFRLSHRLAKHFEVFGRGLYEQHTATFDEFSGTPGVKQTETAKFEGRGYGVGLGAVFVARNLGLAIAATYHGAEFGRVNGKPLKGSRTAQWVSTDFLIMAVNDTDPLPSSAASRPWWKALLGLPP